MLKITRTFSSNSEITLQLDGRLTGKWVDLLREFSESALDEGVRLNVDLKNIYYIDCEGTALLRNLIHRGVNALNAPLFVIEQIKKCREPQI
jgi:ABC-type transporter Mla MlaB component